jgi:hypothetical protein
MKLYVDQEDLEKMKEVQAGKDTSCLPHLREAPWKGLEDEYYEITITYKPFKKSKEAKRG